MRRKKFVKLLLGCGSLWIILVLYFYTSLDVALESVWHSLMNRALDKGRIKKLMTLPAGDETWKSRNPIEELVLKDEGILNFYHLPLRQFGKSFTELTTANRETSKPFAADFTFHINYSDSDVLLYEDHGPGCVFRIYLFPALPTDSNKLHALTAKDLRKDFVHLEVDGRNFWFSVEQMMKGEEWPFLHPINTKHPTPASGLGAYTPFCYHQDIKISYHPSNSLPPNLFQRTIDCSVNELTCPVKIYSSISRHKYPVGTPVSSFAHSSMSQQEVFRHSLEVAADVLSQPEKNGPDSGHQCVLTCVELCKNCKRTIFEQVKSLYLSFCTFSSF